MLSVRCPNCEKPYQIPEKLSGKRVKCKKCGKPFSVPDPAPDPEPEGDLLGSLGQGAAEPRAGSPPSPDTAAIPPLPGAERSPTSTGLSEITVVTGFGPYMRDIGRSLLFFTRGGDLATFLIISVLVSLQIALAYAGCLGVIGSIIIMGWFMAFQLNVVAGAAGGEEDLPNLTLGGLGDGIILPLFKWLAAWVAALLPFILGLLYLVVLGGQLAAAGASTAFFEALAGDFLSVMEQHDALGWIVAGLLLLAPMTLWPILVLVVAVGGVPCLARPDLIFATIFKTFPAYALVVILTFAGVVAPGLLPDETSMGVQALFVVLQVYANIFTMRVIGLYYHHFKVRFAWSWG